MREMRETEIEPAISGRCQESHITVQDKRFLNLVSLPLCIAASIEYVLKRPDTAGLGQYDQESMRNVG